MAEDLILALHVTMKRTSGALITTRGDVRETLSIDHPEAAPYEGFLAVSFESIRASLKGVCRHLGERLGSKDFAGSQLLAMGMGTPEDTILLVGSENEFLTPVLFGRGVPVPNSEIDPDFQDNPALSAAFSQSPIRQLERGNPGRFSGLLRISSLGAALCREMTRYWIECAACPPTGMPYDLQRAEPKKRRGLWAAAGISWTVSPLLVPPGGVIAQLGDIFAQQTGIPSYVPLIATGDPFGLIAAYTKNHSRRWLVHLTDELVAGWVGSAPAPDPRPPQISGLTIQFVPNEPVGTPIPDECVRLGERMVWRLGPRNGEATFKLRSASRLLRKNLWERGADPLHPSAEPRLGCDGLRFLLGADTGLFVGLRAAHSTPDLRLAVLEGLGAELKRWAIQGLKGGTDPEPFYLVLSDDWPVDETAQLFSDLLGAPLFCLTNSELSEERLTLQALAASLVHQIDSTIALPEPSRKIYLPTARAEEYQQRFFIHLQLMKLLQPLIG